MNGQQPKSDRKPYIPDPLPLDDCFHIYRADADGSNARVISVSDYAQGFVQAALEKNPEALCYPIRHEDAMVIREAAELAKGEVSTTVLIVKRPDDWKPTGAGDAPPSYEDPEEHVEPSEYEARAYAKGFNEAELRDPSGWWAIVPAPSQAEVRR